MMADFEHERDREQDKIKYLNALQKKRFNSSLKGFAQEWESIKNNKKNQQHLLKRYFKWQNKIHEYKCNQLIKIKAQLNDLAEEEKLQNDVEMKLNRDRITLDKMKDEHHNGFSKIRGERNELHREKEKILAEMRNIDELQNRFSNIDVNNFDFDEISRINRASVSNAFDMDLLDNMGFSDIDEDSDETETVTITRDTKRKSKNRKSKDNKSSDKRRSRSKSKQKSSNKKASSKGSKNKKSSKGSKNKKMDDKSDKKRSKSKSRDKKSKDDQKSGDKRRSRSKSKQKSSNKKASSKGSKNKKSSKGSKNKKMDNKRSKSKKRSSSKKRTASKKRGKK